jgi:hypothetical protein
MIAAPALWMTIVASIILLAAFLTALRWMTRPDPRIESDWREIDERIRRKL